MSVATALRPIDACEADRRLVAGLRARDEEAFVYLVTTHRDRLLAVAMRILRNEDDAQDAVQTAFIAVLRGVHRFEAKSRVTTWLHRIVVNAALMRLRSRRRHPEQSLWSLVEGASDVRRVAAATRTAWADSPEGLLLRREEAARLRRILARLKPEYRRVIELRDCQELSTKQAARRLAVSTTATKVRHHRARRALRTALRASQNGRSDGPYRSH